MQNRSYVFTDRRDDVFIWCYEYLLGALFHYGKDQLLKPTGFCSRRLIRKEINYSVLNLEQTGANYVFKTFKCFLSATKFVVITDNRAFSFLRISRNLVCKLTCFAFFFKSLTSKHIAYQETKLRKCP